MLDYLLDRIREVDEIDEIHLVTNAPVRAALPRLGSGGRDRPRRRHDVERGPARRDRGHRVHDRAGRPPRRRPLRRRRRQPDRLLAAGLRRLLARERRQRDRRLRGRGPLAASASTASSSSTTTIASSASRRSPPSRRATSPRRRRTSTAAPTSSCWTSYLEEGNAPDAPGNFAVWLHTRAPLYGYRFSGEWHDIGDLGQLLDCGQPAPRAAPACRSATNIRSTSALRSRRRAYGGSVLLDLVFPRRCVVCGGPAQALCGSCSDSLRRLGEPRCERCGAPTAWPVERCRECSGRRIAFASARAAVAYDDAARLLVAAWKERGLRKLAALAAELVCRGRPAAERVHADLRPGRPESPPRPRPQPGRAPGGEIGARWQLPVASLLARAHGVAPQRGLPLAERRRNVRGVFQATGRAPGAVVLVDDVYTSGATVSAAATALRKAGATTSRGRHLRAGREILGARLRCRQRSFWLCRRGVRLSCPCVFR